MVYVVKKKKKKKKKVNFLHSLYRSTPGPIPIAHLDVYVVVMRQ